MSMSSKGKSSTAATASQPVAIKSSANRSAVPADLLGGVGLAKSCPDFRLDPPKPPLRRPAINTIDPPPLDLPPSPPVTLTRLTSTGERKTIRRGASSRADTMVCSISLPSSAPNDSFLSPLTDDMSSLSISTSSSAEPLSPSSLSTDSEALSSKGTATAPSPVSSASTSAVSSRSSSAADLIPPTTGSARGSGTNPSALGQLLGQKRGSTSGPIGMSNNGTPLTISPTAPVDTMAGEGPSTPTIFSVLQSANMSAPRSPACLTPGSVGNTRRVGFSSRARMSENNGSIIANSTPARTRSLFQNANTNGISNGHRHKASVGDDDNDLQFSISLGHDTSASLLDSPADFD